MSGRYVYRAPWEIAPRTLTDGKAHMVRLGAATITGEGMMPCPAWGCGAPPVRWPFPIVEPIPVMPVPIWRNYPGATATVPQPPPLGPSSGSVVSAPGGTPGAPQPSPSVAVGADQTAPQLTQPGTVLDSAGNSVNVASGFGAWLSEQTLIAGIPNWGIAGAAAFALLWMFKGKR
jgi:hypothetical protein